MDFIEDPSAMGPLPRRAFAIPERLQYIQYIHSNMLYGAR